MQKQCLCAMSRQGLQRGAGRGRMFSSSSRGDADLAEGAHGPEEALRARPWRQSCGLRGLTTGDQMLFGKVAKSVVKGTLPVLVTTLNLSELRCDPWNYCLGGGSVCQQSRCLATG